KTADVESPETWRRVELGPGAALWLAPLAPDVEERCAALPEAQLRYGTLGQAVIKKWIGIRVDTDVRWRPRVRANGTIPFSRTNAGLLMVRCSQVRAAVEAALEH